MNSARKPMEETMKSIRNLSTAAAVLMMTAGPAFAVDTTKTYSSGILVGAFLAFCALVVVVQLLPTIMLLVGFIKGLFRGTAKAADRQNSKS